MKVSGGYLLPLRVDMDSASIGEEACYGSGSAALEIYWPNPCTVVDATPPSAVYFGQLR